MVVDSQPAAVQALRSLLAGEPDLDLVAVASDWWTAVRIAGDTDLDICILDVSRQDQDGVVATRRLKQARPGLRVIALADDHDIHALERLLGSGISAYLLKRKAVAELVPAIRSVAESGVYLGEVRRERSGIGDTWY